MLIHGIRMGLSHAISSDVRASIIVSDPIIVIIIEQMYAVIIDHPLDYTVQLSAMPRQNVANFEVAST